MPPLNADRDITKSGLRAEEQSKTEEIIGKQLGLWVEMNKTLPIRPVVYLLGISGLRRYIESPKAVYQSEQQVESEFSATHFTRTWLRRKIGGIRGIKDEIQLLTDRVILGDSNTEVVHESQQLHLVLQSSGRMNTALYNTLTPSQTTGFLRDAQETVGLIRQQINQESVKHVASYRVQEPAR